MRIQLSDHFTYNKLLRFTLPSVLMILCTSVYSIVDGFFVSNFVGKTPFAAINLVMPVFMGIATIGFMIGTGGSAIVSKTMGEDKKELANEYFSMLIYAALALGIFASAAGFFSMGFIAKLLGAKGELQVFCVQYGRILFLSLPAYILQFAFQSFFVTAEKPGLSLKVSIAAGFINAILDYLFIAVFRWGIMGAALATAAGQYIAGLTPLVYFLKKNSSLLRLTTKPHFYGEILKKTCTNGASEMVTNLSSSVVGILYNFQLMRFAGENGVAALGVIRYIDIVFMAVYLGYSVGSAPIISFHYGAQNYEELQNLYKKSLRLMCGFGIVLTAVSQILVLPLVSVFTGYDAGLMEMTVHAFRVYALSFLVMGVNIWGSSFFTALNNGSVSAAISFLRTFVFQIGATLLLPHIWGLDGLWLVTVTAEVLSVFVTAGFLVGKREQYQYT